MSYPITNVLKRKRVFTSELKNNERIEYYRNQGFHWIKRIENKNFKQIIRNPTIGCYVELTTIYRYGTVPINSYIGKKIITKLCYF
jgi:hypothetical protein